MNEVKVVEVQPKWIGKSMTFWGAAISAIAVVYQVGKPILDSVGVTIPVTPADIQAAGNAGSAIITAIGGVAGLALTIIGRMRAGKVVQPVTILPTATPTVAEVKIVTPPAIPKSTG